MFISGCGTIERNSSNFSSFTALPPGSNEVCSFVNFSTGISMNMKRVSTELTGKSISRWIGRMDDLSLNRGCLIIGSELTVDSEAKSNWVK